MIGIISYLPNDVTLREHRLNIHRQQLDWLNKMFSNQPIIIVSQNYSSVDYTNSPYIKYIKYENGIGPSNARNIILKQFYNSTDDVLFLLDDDILMYDYYDVTPLLIDFYTNCNKYNFDVLIPNNPEFMPFKKFIFEKTDYTNYYTLKKASLNCSPNSLLIKNIYKFNNLKLYYEDVDFNADNCIAEDMLFISNLLYNGLKIYQCLNWIKKSPARNKSTIFKDTNTKENKLKHKKLVDNTFSRIRQLYNINDNVNVSKNFNKLYNNHDTYINIKRFEPYILSENLKPNYQTNYKPLF